MKGGVYLNNKLLYCSVGVHLYDSGAVCSSVNIIFSCLVSHHTGFSLLFS